MAVRQALKASARSEMETLSTRFLEGEFAARHVAPLVPEAGDTDASAWAATVVRAKDTGRITIRYDLDGRFSIYAKLYSDELGARSWDAHQHLWNTGFGAASAYRVPEPLAFLDEDRLLLMRSVAGGTVADLLKDGPSPAINEAVRRAARWLAQLHATPMPQAEMEPAVERVKVVKLGNILARSSAARSERRDVLLDLLQRIRLITPPPGSDAKLVPTHGQYTPRSIFLLPDAVTVIDIDRVVLSDAAKDLAMFVQRIRKMAHNATGDLAWGEELAGAFLDEYRQLAGGLPLNLPYYGAFYAVKRFVESCKEEGDGGAMGAYYMAEFKRWESEGMAVLDSVEQEPPVERRHVVPHLGREELGHWMVKASPGDLIGRYIFPDLAHDRAAADALECETTVVQDTGTGRLTLRYVFPENHVIFAKLYSDGLGEYSFRLQQTLWKNGFGPGSPFQVPEPLAFIPEHKLVLMRGVAGTPLGSTLNGNGSPEFVEGTKHAARWLGALHSTTVRMGTPEPDWDSLKLFRICVRLVKAAARRPEHLDLVLDLMDLLKRQIRQLPEQRVVVQTHGRYHHDHVFIGADNIAVIDLDRSRPTDPSKDAAEFIRVLRWTMFKTGRDMRLAQAATDAFLTEYLAHVPDARGSLAYYWSAFLLLSVLGTIGKMAGDDPRWQPTVDFYMRELQHAKDLRL